LTKKEQKGESRCFQRIKGERHLNNGTNNPMEEMKYGLARDRELGLG
jgi:hypothetical protein